MRAVIAQNGQLIKVQHPTPKPSAALQEALVKIYYTAVNRADILQRKGLYPPPSNDDTLGLEMSGVVVGDGTSKFPPGSRVMSILESGGYAEYVTVPQDLLLPVPNGMTLFQAAGVPEAWMTAYQLLHTISQVKSGNTVLIHAGGSGVGTAAVQMAAVAGCHVLVTAGTDEKIQRCIDLGAVGGVNYKTCRDGKWSVPIKDMAGTDGVNAVLDCIGGSYWEQNMDVLAMDGRWTLYGAMGGTKVNGPFFGKVLQKRLRLEGTTLRSRSVDYKKDLTSCFARDILPFLENGRYQAILDKKSFSLEDVEASHEYVERNANIGKVILKVDESEK